MGEHLPYDHGAGDDHGRPLRLQGGYAAPLRQRERGEPGELPVDALPREVEPVDPVAVARQMVFSLQHERSDLLEYYLKFLFAFPDAANPLIEEAEEIQRDILVRVLAGKPAHAVYHPYPVSIPRLYEAMSPYLTAE